MSIWLPSAIACINQNVNKAFESHVPQAFTSWGMAENCAQCQKSDSIY